eukprot:12710933-Ditylum_brightwellii.AAC.1
MGACCSQHLDIELNYVYTGGEGEADGYGRWKPVGPINATSVEIDPLVKEIGNGAFHGCNKIKSITPPDNVQVVGVWAFGGCDALSMVELPPILKKIKRYAFYKCKSLTSLKVPEGTEEI